MGILLLLLLLCAATSADFYLPVRFEHTGYWYTLHLSSNRPEAIEEGGRLRIYMRHVQCSDIETCDRMTLTFYTRIMGECQKQVMVATRDLAVYKGEYSGQTNFFLYYRTDQVLILLLSNRQAGGDQTYVAAALGRGDQLSPSDLAMFKKAIKQWRLKNTPIVDVHQSDTCPE